MNKQKVLISSLALVALGSLGYFTVGEVYAQTAERLSPEIMQEFRLERQAANKAAMQDRLSQAVEDGSITQEQKDKLVVKLAEVEATREAHRLEIQAWAEENGIDESLLMGFGHGRGQGQGQGNGEGRLGGFGPRFEE